MGCKLGTDFFSCLFEGSEDQIQKESEDQVQKEAAQKEAESVGPVDQLKKDLPKGPRQRGRPKGKGGSGRTRSKFKSWGPRFIAI